MNGANLHAVMQTQADFGKFIAVVIGIVAASLVLSQKAFGQPAKGNHRSVVMFISNVLLIVFAIAFNVAVFSVGYYSQYAAILFALVTFTQIVNFLYLLT